MPFLRSAFVCVLVAIVAGACAPRQPGLPQTVTVGDAGDKQTMSGGAAAVLVAQLAITRRDYAQAAVLATAAINSGQLQGNDLAQAYAVRGDAYYLNASAARARDDWQKAVEIHGQNANGLRGLAVIAHLQRKFPESKRYFQRAIDAEPKNAGLYMTRGILRIEDRRELNLAVADFDTAIAIRPQLGSAYFYRGLVHHLGGRYAVARADYEKALHINPGDRRAREALALIEQRRAPPAAPPRRGNDVVQF